MRGIHHLAAFVTNKQFDELLRGWAEAGAYCPMP